MAKYKTANNLKEIWKHLDDASGSIYNAIELIGDIKSIDSRLKEELERLDPTAIDSLKNDVEEAINKKGVKIFF